MDKLLDEVGKLLKTKKNNQIFDLTSIHGWDLSMDKKLNEYIEQKQICGIELNQIDNGVCKYKTTLLKNYAVYIPNDDLIDKAKDVLKKQELYKDMNGYSRELKDYCEEISIVLNQMIDDQSNFIDYNNAILLQLLGNEGIQLISAYGTTYYRVSLGGTPTIDKLIDLHSNCVRRLLAQ